jgi:G6PDH family F420-dependent oxidoreductase
MRYHPAVVAQLAATVQLLSEGRFRLGLGAGENLNEHVVGGGWPPADVRHEMLREAVGIIQELFKGGYVNARGRHFQVESARLWDVPDTPPPIGIAVSGPSSLALARELADLVIAVQPQAELVLGDRPAVGQLPVSFDRDRKRAVVRAHEQFRWFGGGWKVNAELPGPASFDAASAFVREEDVAESIPCGDDPGAVVEAVRAFTEAGFDQVALVQVGGDAQDAFLDWAGEELLPALRAL